MDYKEKYEQALSRARQFSEKPLLEDSAGIVEYIFPELAESEDERIRKEIRDFICWATDRGCITKEQLEKSNSWLAWLTSPLLSNSSIIGKNEQARPDIEEAIKEVEEKAKVFTEAYKGESSDDILAQMRGEQKPAWSEEDEEILKLIKFAVSNLPSQREDTRQECLEWLKSLKDRVK